MGMRPDRWRLQRAQLCAAIMAAGLILTVVGCGVSFSNQTTRAGGGGRSALALHISAFPQHTVTNDINQAMQARDGGIAAQVLYMSAFFQTDIPALDHTIADPAQAAALYAALRALPPYPKGTYYCPNGSGNTYDLTFSRGQMQTSWAIVHPGGCEAVDLPNGDVRWAMGQDHFWAVFASALGAPESDLLQGRPV